MKSRFPFGISFYVGILWCSAHNFYGEKYFILFIFSFSSDLLIVISYQIFHAHACVPKVKTENWAHFTEHKICAVAVETLNWFADALICELKCVFYKVAGVFLELCCAVLLAIHLFIDRQFCYIGKLKCVSFSFRKTKLAFKYFFSNEIICSEPSEFVLLEIWYFIYLFILQRQEFYCRCRPLGIFLCVWKLKPIFIFTGQFFWNNWLSRWPSI